MCRHPLPVTGILSRAVPVSSCGWCVNGGEGWAETKGWRFKCETL